MGKGDLVKVMLVVAVVLAMAYMRTTVTHPHTTATTGSYTFIATTPNGRPVTFDPCQPIHYVVDPTGMPYNGLKLIRDGIRTISAATGLTFVEDGLTLERPGLNRRPLIQPQRYGQRWAPVLIAWVDQVEYPPVSGDVAGAARSEFVRQHGPESARYVTGQIVFDREDFAMVLLRDDGYAEARAIVMHELGHLVGLDHVDNPGELMAADNTGQLAFGPGDRQGLAGAGKGPCGPAR